MLPPRLPAVGASFAEPTMILETIQLTNPQIEAYLAIR